MRSDDKPGAGTREVWRSAMLEASCHAQDEVLKYIRDELTKKGRDGTPGRVLLDVATRIPVRIEAELARGPIEARLAPPPPGTETRLPPPALEARCEEPGCGWTGPMGALNREHDSVTHCPRCNSTAIVENVAGTETPGSNSTPHPFREQDEDDLCAVCRGLPTDPIHRPVTPDRERFAREEAHKLATCPGAWDGGDHSLFCTALARALLAFPAPPTDAEALLRMLAEDLDELDAWETWKEKGGGGQTTGSLPALYGLSNTPSVRSYLRRLVRDARKRGDANG